MSTELLQRRASPLPAGTPALAQSDVKNLLTQIPAWEAVEGHHLRRQYKFADFAGALRWVNRIGAIAEAEQHHPDIELGWGRVVVTTYTHSVGGLSINDFILAAKIDAAPAD
ncbi:MAG: 4a-hydroxytetrahydrobiopterin dehydratase [Terriglobales bacterium]